METIAGIEEIKLAILVYAPAHVHAHTHPPPPRGLCGALTAALLHICPSRRPPRRGFGAALPHTRPGVAPHGTFGHQGHPAPSLLL